MAPPDDIKQIQRLLDHPGKGTSDFDLNPDIDQGSGIKLRPAAVLVALQETGFGTQVVLTKRTSSLKHHPGQIAFAGGKVDETDPSPIHAALREANEEIGLDPDTVDVLGTLPNHITVTGFSVVPVVARITARFDPRPEPDEVAEIFRVPLAHVSDLSNFQVQSRRWQGKARYYQTVPYGPYYIWGATARMLHGLAERLAQ